MARPDDALQAWFDGLPGAIYDDLAQVIAEEADGLAVAMQERVRRKSGTLAGTIKVRRRSSELDLEVVAGGDETTKEVRSGSGEDYDYALAIEYGTSKMPAYPFFWNTVRERMDGIQQRIGERAGAAIGRHTGSAIGTAFTVASFGRILGGAFVDVAKPPALAAPVLELNLVDGVWS
jgi:hypothetical protein